MGIDVIILTTESANVDQLVSSLALPLESVYELLSHIGCGCNIEDPDLWFMLSTCWDITERLRFMNSKYPLDPDVYSFLIYKLMAPFIYGSDEGLDYSFIEQFRYRTDNDRSSITIVPSSVCISIYGETLRIQDQISELRDIYLKSFDFHPESYEYAIWNERNGDTFKTFVDILNDCRKVFEIAIERNHALVTFPNP